MLEADQRSRLDPVETQETVTRSLGVDRRISRGSSDGSGPPLCGLVRRNPTDAARQSTAGSGHRIASGTGRPERCRGGEAPRRGRCAGDGEHPFPRPGPRAQPRRASGPQRRLRILRAVGGPGKDGVHGNQRHGPDARDGPGLRLAESRLRGSSISPPGRVELAGFGDRPDGARLITAGVNTRGTGRFIVVHDPLRR